MFKPHPLLQVVQLPNETYATDIHWLPSKKTGSEMFVLACTDGRFLLVSRLGRVEKSVEAHKGAVLGAQWSSDATAMLTCEITHTHTHTHTHTLALSIRR